MVWARDRIKFSLASGRRVWLLDFRFHETYRSILEGLPNEAFNDRLIKRTREEAAGKSGLPVYFPTPEIRYDGIARPPFSGRLGAPLLKPFLCFATLRSTPKSHGGSGSGLVVVWFAEPFFSMPLSQFIAESLADLDWEALAVDFLD